MIVSNLRRRNVVGLELVSDARKITQITTYSKEVCQGRAPVVVSPWKYSWEREAYGPLMFCACRLWALEYVRSCQMITRSGKVIKGTHTCWL
jgi:hypothetical protein